MTDPLSLHPPQVLLSTLCQTITDKIKPLSRAALQQNGTKLFGAAILLKKDLSLVLADTNQEAASPLWHGETYTIAQFFSTIPVDQRPPPKDCVFLTTHEPCSLCINAIVWAGFDNFVYMWTYEETDELFGIDGDLKVWEKCFYDDGQREIKGGPQQASKDGKLMQRRPEYRLTNDFFVARSFAELVAAVEKQEEKNEWIAQVEEVKRSYGSLSPVFRERTGLTE